MQSTENTTSARPELDQLIRDLYCDDGYALNRLRSQHAAVALAAERDRADRAEAALARAWDEGERYGTKFFGQHSFMPVNPYRSAPEATA